MQNTIQNQLLEIFDLSLKHFGKRNWWPGDSALETIFGCILTQNVTWKNVEEAIINLKSFELINIDNFLAAPDAQIHELIKSTRYFAQKTNYLKCFCTKIVQDFNGNLDNMFLLSIEDMRKYLLSIKGIGKETADSIILYASNKPIFVVDTYTKRIFSRLGYIDSSDSYDIIQSFFYNNLPTDTYIFNEFHALIVCLSQSFCRNSKPLCSQCVLRNICNFYSDNV